ncbi:transcriptional regulator [Pleomorphomonas diazotrophica]|uniref:Transcriptional regulator n=1 Tax=Pleomorphomonas diazotrophica TaxID=1166257 RepID=A0A1I4V2Y3_9HYPH|nr:helix-turn-helix domain-containing protein [Pleomorphomonas diazotrophica]PKR88712.1 transcriptional regulator [Pleomorphomonas diazotrophica]SFM95515.1 DNA-binding transcriptional regulator, HxlR family [Pleomorphomonas diazotrophica]
MHLSDDYVFDAPAPRAATDCPVEDWLEFLGHRWNASILWHLSVGPRRFNLLAEHLPGITPKVLSERLQALEMRGLVERHEGRTFPRSVTYALTPDGAQVNSVIQLLEPLSKRLGERG